MNRIRSFWAVVLFVAFSPCFIISAVAEDKVITSAELQQVSQTNFWYALSVLESSFVMADRSYQGDVLGYVPAESAVRGFNRWTSRAKSRNILFLIDGNRVPLSTARALNVSDIKEIRVITDAVSLAAWGINGADGVVEVTTLRPAVTPLKVTYHLNLSMFTADKSPYSAQQKSVSGPTNWLSQPLQTGFSQRHQIDAGGSDGAVSYKFTASFAPANRGVMKGSGNDDLNLRAYVGYRHKAINVYNDLAFDYYKARTSNFGRWGDMALINGTESPYDGLGMLRPFIDVNGKQVPNPVYEHSLGSFFKEQTGTLTDRLGVDIDLPYHLQFKGNFSYARQYVRYDDFVSPSSAIFMANTDLRANGTYHIRRSGYVSYEGGASLNHQVNVGKGRLVSALGFNIFDGHRTGESYGGRGILSDRMAYITFTQGYDTLQAPVANRLYERTLRLFVTADYHFNQRYGIMLAGNLNRSNLLAPNHRSMFYGAGKAYWNMHNETWLKTDWLKTLRLYMEAGTTGIVPFSYTDFYSTYTNDTHDEYIYNYYQIGARLNHKPNRGLKPIQMLMLAAGVEMRTKTGQFHVEVYRNHAADQLALRPLPAFEGFYSQVANGGNVINSGLELTASDKLLARSNFSLNGWTALRLNHNHVADVPTYYRERVIATSPSMMVGLEQTTLRGSIGLQALWKQWSAGATVAGVTGSKQVDYLSAAYMVHNDNRLQLTSLWLAHTLKLQGKFVSAIHWSLTGSNLLTWRSAKVAEGICYPLTRSLSLSASVKF